MASSFLKGAIKTAPVNMLYISNYEEQNDDH
jgi:hypothetical protein